MEPTAPSTRSPARSPGRAGEPPHRLSVDAAAASHIGKVREANEDAYLLCRIARSLERVASSLPESVLGARIEETGLVMVVADGMGGMAGGEVASQTALTTMVDLIQRAPKWILHLDDAETREAEIRELWTRAREFVAAIHESVARRARTDPSLAGMGTTLTIAYSVGADLFVVHVGDSCAYLFRDGKVTKITRDHTLAQEYVESGLGSASDPSVRRLSHVLTRAIGGPEDTLSADLHALRLEPGDRLLLCTDGLTRLVDTDEIAEILGRAGSSREACDTFIDQALDSGGVDNVTVIVAGYAASDSKADA